MTAIPTDIFAVSAENKAKATPRTSKKTFHARYDGAQTTSENQAHWANADGLSACAANNPGVRRTLRNRSRYEIANSGYADGIIETLANYVIGTGPRLQMLTDDPKANALIEKLFHAWARRVKLAMKLWVMRFACASDGETFGVFGTNLALRDRVKLDLKVIECDRVTDPRAHFGSLQRGDGIIYDDFDNPLAYQILRYHPGDFFTGYPIDEYDTVRASEVIHFFKQTRPEQTRGVPELTPSIDLFAQLRRFTLAVIGAAESAANPAGVMSNTGSPEDTDDERATDYTEIEIPRRSLLQLPDGQTFGQVKAEQPTTTYPQFKDEVLAESARPLNMPHNIASARTSSNFASAKLDFAVFDKAIGVDQFRVEEEALEPTLEKWFEEARLIPGYLPDGIDLSDGLPAHEWFWDGQEQLDPREAGAQQTALESGANTFPRIYARRGLDFEKEHRAQAAALGIPYEEFQKLLVQKLFASPTAKPAPGSPNDPNAVDEPAGATP